MPSYRVGSRLYSAVCSTEVMVIRSPADEVTITCGGAPMSTSVEGSGSGALVEGHEGGTLVGKRYGDELSGLELLCTKGGDGSLGCDGRELAPQAAKALPSSD